MTIIVTKLIGGLCCINNFLPNDKSQFLARKTLFLRSKFNFSSIILGRLVFQHHVFSDNYCSLCYPSCSFNLQPHLLSWWSSFLWQSKGKAIIISELKDVEERENFTEKNVFKNFYWKNCEKSVGEKALGSFEKAAISCGIHRLKREKI